MPSTDITYCTRECGNMECKSNKEHRKDVYDVYVAYHSGFKDCKEWRGKYEANRCIDNDK